MNNNQQYIIVNTSQISAINFEQVLENSPETLRYSVDKSLTFLNWYGSMPSSITNIPSQYKQGPFTSEEIIAILSTATWSAYLTG